PVDTEGVVHDAGDVGEGVTTAEAVLQRELLAVRVAGERGVLAAVTVVEQDAGELDEVEGAGDRRVALVAVGGRLEGPCGADPRQGEHDLAEAVEVEVLADQ